MEFFALQSEAIVIGCEEIEEAVVFADDDREIGGAVFDDGAAVAAVEVADDDLVFAVSLPEEEIVEPAERFELGASEVNVVDFFGFDIEATELVAAGPECDAGVVVDAGDAWDETELVVVAIFEAAGIFAVGWVFAAKDDHFVVGVVANPLFVPVAAHSDANRGVDGFWELGNLREGFFAVFIEAEFAMSLGLIVGVADEADEAYDVAIIGDRFDVFSNNIGKALVVDVDEAKLAVLDRPKLRGGAVGKVNGAELELEGLAKINAAVGVLEVNKVPAGFFAFGPLEDDFVAVFVPGNSF